MQVRASFPFLMALSLSLSVAGLGCTGKSAAPTQVELTTEILGTIKGGQGSGVVGFPVEGVSITLTAGDKTLGPLKSDSSGSFTIDAYELLPPGTERSPAGLKKVAPVTVDLKLSKEGFKTQVEVITVPFPKSQDMVFYISGQ